ncbi:hypothetical protein K431DRAFT_288546 [Polychaeton citri CBS 116435]|uniref:FAS1 domain-containing protein n=1 Tax=Polychaeton citri CBS 116435 TaxID=1314669 RepID=A0A9P4UKF6_9PEZI|nr:hypothetical protein K431DRAFT_288546 [Polychaeton citri CBS 116435]
MNPKLLATCVITAGVLAQAQLIPLIHKSSPSSIPSAARVDPARLHNQQVMQRPGIQLPTMGDDKKKPPVPPDGPAKGDVILSDVMGSQRQINVFASFARDTDSVSIRFDTASQNTTVLAPVNGAISDLSRKPWEDLKDYEMLGENAYAGKNGEDRAHRNLRRFTEAHIVPVSPWGEGEKVKTLSGREIWWERREEGSFVQPGNVAIDKIVSQVANGEVWVLKGVLNYE